MAKYNRTILKGYFETGDIPSQAQYGDLIDSNLNLAGAANQEIASGVTFISAVTASGNISSSGDIITQHITASGDIVTGGNLYIESDKFIVFAGENNSNTRIREVGGNLNIEAFGHLNIFPDHDFKIYSGSTLYATFDGQTQGLQLGSTNTTPPETLTVEGSISGSGNLKIDGSQVDFTNLPTSNPGVAGRLYNDSGTVKISL